MIDPEIDAVLAILTAAYPDKVLSVEEMGTWRRNLASVNFDAGVAAAERIVEHPIRGFPAVVEFRQVAATTRRRPVEPQAPTQRASHPTDFRARGLAHIAELRLQLRGEDPTP